MLRTAAVLGGERQPGEQRTARRPGEWCGSDPGSVLLANAPREIDGASQFIVPM